MSRRNTKSPTCPFCGQHTVRSKALAPSDRETILAIIGQESHKAGITPGDLMGSCRKAEITAARWNAICRAHEETKAGIGTLARIFGKDRKSIRYALEHHA